MERDFATRLENERRRAAEAGAADGAARVARAHILERILTLACPRCGQAFVDFEGCFALTCSRAGCGCRFCAYCLTDCGRDAHPHVRTCPKNTAPGRDIYGDEARFVGAQQTRRSSMLREYLATLPADVRSRAVRDCAQELRDLGIAPNDFIS